MRRCTVADDIPSSVAMRRTVQPFAFSSKHCSASSATVAGFACLRAAPPVAIRSSEQTWIVLVVLLITERSSHYLRHLVPLLDRVERIQRCCVQPLDGLREVS